MQHNEIPYTERIIASGSYLTMGLVGFVWFLLSYFVLKKEMSKFLSCNIFQSFIISILCAVLSIVYDIVMRIIFAIPFIGKFFYFLHVLIFSTPIFNTLTLANFITLAILLYLSIFPLFGTLPFIPYITNVVKSYRQ